ncbi:MAG: hypothetical protein COX29_03100 [Candidatus Moranbacteria bacterium CG23_combo_of_CG06-09_8_20_14_all_35_22]|nr:MAG: hypothetical protein COX29_03100 [Candidatus Moranbacteria bacterium CG23_combo_of_CG06-09_8_20_14_all_35_22]
MNQDKKQQIIALLRARISDAEIRAHSYVFEDGKKRPNRNVYVKVKEHFNKFISGDKSRRWVILTGLRGAGKTTLMSQIFFDAPKEATKLFLSVDQIDQSISLKEILFVYENDFLGMSFAQFGKPVFLFLDEIQYDKGWGMALKAIYDNAPNVFIFVTGSSALSMNINIDVARRPIFEKVFPLSFCEYKKIKEWKTKEKGLGKEMRDIFLQAQSARELFTEMKKLEPKINNYLTEIKNKDFNDYITYASLPSLVSLGEPVLAYDQVKNILDRVVGQDILQTEEFNAETLNKIKDILYITASADKVSFSAIGNNTGIQLHYMTVSHIFEILQQTEVLMRILPFSVSHNTQVRQASKFLFSAPVFRAMYFHLRGSVLSPEEARGKLLEDIVGMYLNRILYRQKEVHLNYDAESGGADFIVGFGNRDIVIEVSTDKKTIKQVINTMHKIKSTYGIVISEKQDILDINEEYNIIKIPFKYFLLM